MSSSQAAPAIAFRSACPQDPSHVVGIGASAGGIEALRVLLQRFTADCTAFVVVMHLSPDRDSQLTAILANATSMKVVTAADDQVLETNCIYVIPPGYVLTLTDEGTLRLTTLPPTYPRWTIDAFLTSLSEIGPAAIGIILSGAGSDGARGLQAIKERGGITFVQDPGSALFAPMPEAALPFADHILAPAALGDALMVTVGARQKAVSE
jgi:two-component system CheB/CheR fusion protein